MLLYLKSHRYIMRPLLHCQRERICRRQRLNVEYACMWEPRDTPISINALFW